MLTADLAQLIVDYAPKLREAGVSSLSVGDVVIALTPHVDQSVAPEDVEPDDPYDDPTTYGLSPGSPVPGFAALRQK